VIAGFTSGIAAIIFIGQIDNFLGAKTEAAENSLLKLWNYTHGVTVNPQAVALGLIVIVTMLVWPRINAKIPGSLVGIILATVVAVGLRLEVPVIGAIPRTILLEQRLRFAAIPLTTIFSLITPAISIAALGAIESLLCGAVGGQMTGQKMEADTELVAQGLGNILIPFFGGVPATAAIARTSVGIKSGGVTRMMSFVHAAALLLSALLLGPIIGRVPLAALAGVLMVTAWRMNEWAAIRFYFGRRFKHAMGAFALTLLATVTLDLTQAIIIGVAISGMVFISQISELSITREPVNVGALREQGHLIAEVCPLVNVFYLSGPLFFGAARNFVSTIEAAGEIKTIILSMRGVPLIDASGIEALHEIWHHQQKRGGSLLLAGVQPSVKRMLNRAGMVEEIGEENFFWSADRAILAAEYQRMNTACTFCTRPGIVCPLRESVTHSLEQDRRPVRVLEVTN
jgi:SulP family sulfate permease